eukprot:324961-Prymnesium_polylepis.1
MPRVDQSRAAHRARRRDPGAPAGRARWPAERRTAGHHARVAAAAPAAGARLRPVALGERLLALDGRGARRLGQDGHWAQHRRGDDQCERRERRAGGRCAAEPRAHLADGARVAEVALAGARGLARVGCGERLRRGRAASCDKARSDRCAAGRWAAPTNRRLLHVSLSQAFRRGVGALADDRPRHL